MPDVFLGEFSTDIDAPVLLNPMPAPASVDVPVATAITFDIRDSTTGASGVDVNSVVVNVNGDVVYALSAAAPGWVMVVTPLVPAGDWHFSLTKTANLPRDDVINVAVDADDLAPIPNHMPTFVWQFSTEVGVIETPHLFAEGRDGAVDLVWQVNPAMFIVRYELRRSLVAAPTTPTQGDLVFTGTVQVYTDGDVVNGTKYFYTVFVVRKLLGGITPVYVPYADVASADAVPRAIVVNAEVLREYTPKRGEFGAVASFPMAVASAAVWGDLGAHGREDRDLIAADLGTPVLAPVTGTVFEVVAGEQGLHVARIDSQVGGFRFELAQIKPVPGLVAGQIVRAGEVVGRLGPQPLAFSIVKLPTGRYGQRTVRASFFYLTIEARDGGS